MNEPILETIVAKILERVARVTPDNGFYDGITLTAERLKAVCKPESFKAIVYQDEIDDMDATLSATQWTVRFAIAVPIMPAEGDQTPLDQYQNRICACLTVALFHNEDGAFDPQLDGTARRIDAKAPALFAVLPGGLKDGVTFYLDVQYSHAVGDPTAAG